MSKEERQKFLQAFPETFFQVLLLRLKQNSGISACGFFNVNRSLVTSFLATTFTYWVILVQFQHMWTQFAFETCQKIVNFHHSSSKDPDKCDKFPLVLIWVLWCAAGWGDQKRSNIWYLSFPFFWLLILGQRKTHSNFFCQCFIS